MFFRGAFCLSKLVEKKAFSEEYNEDHIMEDLYNLQSLNCQFI